MKRKINPAREKSMQIMPNKMNRMPKPVLILTLRVMVEHSDEINTHRAILNQQGLQGSAEYPQTCPSSLSDKEYE